MQAKQDWEIGELIFKQEGKNNVNDMKEKCQQEISHESTMSDFDGDDNTTSYTSDETKSMTKGESSINVMGIIFSQKTMEGPMPIATKPNPPLK